MTIFNTPILSKALHYLSRFVLWVTGWRVDGKMPDLPKFVLVGAPHTSNWDFVIWLMMVLAMQAKLQFMGKAELFRGAFGWFFYWCGGIPVDRTKSTGLVEQMVDAMRRPGNLILAIAPEGTRDKVRAWKSGFYHIARGADVPVVLAYLDGAKKMVGVAHTFALTNDMEADMKSIQSFYSDMVGINPRLMSELE